MTDLDIQIDVPDDDDLNSPVRVLNGSWVPPWLKAVVALLVGALLALAIGAFLLGRSRAADTTEEGLTPPTIATTTLASAAASPSIESSLQAVQAWETYARDGDLSAVEGVFDSNGPQYGLFARSDGPSGEELDFSARNLSETTDGVVTTVSMDLIVTGPDGQEVYPYDFVYLDGRDQVWTVVDRRSPGTAALPPATEMIESARDNWTSVTAALESGDGSGVIDLVSRDTVALVDQVRTAAGGGAVPADERLIADPALFDVLVERSRRAAASEPGETMLGLLDGEQRQALVVGELTSWTQTDPDRIIASLVVSGQPVTIVPFVASAEGWAFDLVGALNTSGGTP